MNPAEYKSYSQKVIAEIKKKSDSKLKKKLFKDISYLDSLPQELHDRVIKVTQSDFIESDQDDTNIEIMASSSELSTIDDFLKKKVKLDDDFNESMVSDILRSENEFAYFDLKDKPTDYTEFRKQKKKVPKNWFEEYLYQHYTERVKWDSKLRSVEKDKCAVETSLDHFADWFYDTFSNEENTRDEIRKEVKSYFEDDTKRQFLRGYTNMPKEVRAIPKAVAELTQLPEMALEVKYEKFMRNILNTKHKPMISAFGRTLSEKDREWLPKEKEYNIKTIFPDELLSFQVAFEGLEGLNTMKLVTDFFSTHTHIETPSYIKSIGIVKRKSSINRAKNHVPLYDQLNLTY